MNLIKEVLGRWHDKNLSDLDIRKKLARQVLETSLVLGKNLRNVTRIGIRKSLRQGHFLECMVLVGMVPFTVSPF